MPLDMIDSIILLDVMVTKATYKYRFNVNGKVVYCGITSDLKRREIEHRRRWPNGLIEQVGVATTHEEAWNWERQQAEQRLSVSGTSPA